MYCKLHIKNLTVPLNPWTPGACRQVALNLQDLFLPYKICFPQITGEIGGGYADCCVDLFLVF